MATVALSGPSERHEFMYVAEQSYRSVAISNLVFACK